MARQKPEPSEELLYLRKVIGQSSEADDPADTTLKFYRNLITKDDRYVLQQKIAAEEKYAAALATWKKEGKKTKAEEATEEPLEPCEVLVQRLIMEWKE